MKLIETEISESSSKGNNDKSFFSAEFSGPSGATHLVGAPRGRPTLHRSFRRSDRLFGGQPSWICRLQAAITRFDMRLVRRFGASCDHNVKEHLQEETSEHLSTSATLKTVKDVLWKDLQRTRCTFSDGVCQLWPGLKCGRFRQMSLANSVHALAA